MQKAPIHRRSFCTLIAAGTAVKLFPRSALAQSTSFPSPTFSGTIRSDQAQPDTKGRTMPFTLPDLPYSYDAL
ncbi:MAG: hypothetical protein KC561_17625, partial [Myxococcales bacterium]|nr:hypothetical protein [Myxococcales bacterium]